jgi:hypothetical protein
MGLTVNGINWKNVAITFAGGALIGVVGHFRTPPGTISTPKN